MRKILPFLLAFGLAGAASAVGTFNGVVADSDCNAGYDASALGAELYGWKISGGAAISYSDIMADLTIKNGGPANVGGASVTASPAWSLPPNWREPDAANPTVFAVITLNDGRMAIMGGADSLRGGDAGFTNPQGVGAGIPSVWGVRNGMNLAPSARGAKTAAGIAAGIDVRFAPIAEVGGAADTYGVGCHVGAFDPDPNGSLGIIAGYNVYRIPDGGTTPTAADFYAAATDGNAATGGWQAFVPATSFDWTAASTGSRPGGGEQSTATADGDLFGIENPDTTAYTGDDVLVYQDFGVSFDRAPRATGTAPAFGTDYWYAVQPVVASPSGETIANLGGRSLSSSGAWTVAVMDRVPGGGNDSADLDGDGNIEFFSPQADAGIGGYGLTNGSMPLLSAPFHATFSGDPNALPATGEVSLQGSMNGSDVAIQFSTALEAGNVLGFNVYRHQGDARLLVNAQPILASGGEGSVYSLVDDLGQTSRRMRRDGSITYSVDVLYNDGSATQTVGPFTIDVNAGSDAAPRRTR